MTDPATLDKAYNFIISRLVEIGQAPHYSELAVELGYPIEDGRQVLHDLVSAGSPLRLHPDTDLIDAVPPDSSARALTATRRSPSKCGTDKSCPLTPLRLSGILRCPSPALRPRWLERR